MSLRQFIDSVWFRGIARGMMVLTPILVTAWWGVWGVVVGAQQEQIDLVTSKVVAVSQSVADVSATQGERADDAESFQREVRLAVAALTGGLADANEALDGVKVDVGVIRRLVIELRERQIADLGPTSRAPSSILGRSLALE